MNIQLVRINQDEVFTAWMMQKKGYLPTYLKYFDPINPIFNTYLKFSRRMKNDKIVIFWILYNEVRVGELELVLNDDMIHISNFFVLGKYQNKGIGQSAMNIIHKKYSACPYWHLYTIKQEKANCHIYEKLGYIPSGVQHRINKRMTLIEYERKL